MRGLVMVELQLIGHQVLRILCSSRQFPRGLYIGEKGYSIRIAKKKDDRGSSRNGAIDCMAENWVPSETGRFLTQSTIAKIATWSWTRSTTKSNSTRKNFHITRCGR